MNIEDLRLSALKMAIETVGAPDHHRVLDAANKYVEFVLKGREKGDDAQDRPRILGQIVGQQNLAS